MEQTNAGLAQEETQPVKDTKVGMKKKQASTNENKPDDSQKTGGENNKAVEQKLNDNLVAPVER